MSYLCKSRCFQYKTTRLIHMAQHSQTRKYYVTLKPHKPDQWTSTEAVLRSIPFLTTIFIFSKSPSILIVKNLFNIVRSFSELTSQEQNCRVAKHLDANCVTEENSTIKYYLLFPRETYPVKLTLSFNL